MLPHTRYHLKVFDELKNDVQNETSSDLLQCALRRRARKDFAAAEILEPMLKVLTYGNDFDVKMRAAKALLNLSHGFESHLLFLDPETRMEVLIRQGKMEKPKGSDDSIVSGARRRAQKKKKDALTEAFELAGKKKVTDHRDGVQVVIDFAAIQKEECQTVGSCIIMNLAKSYELQGPLLAKGAMDTLVRTMEIPACQWYASAAIWNLTKHERGMQAIRNVLNVLRSVGMVKSDDSAGGGKSLELRLLLEAIPISLRQRCSHLPGVNFGLGTTGDHMHVLGAQITSTDRIVFTLSQYDYNPPETPWTESKALATSRRKKRGTRNNQNTSKYSNRAAAKSQKDQSLGSKDVSQIPETLEEERTEKEVDALDTLTVKTGTSHGPGTSGSTKEKSLSKSSNSAADGSFIAEEKNSSNQSEDLHRNVTSKSLDIKDSTRKGFDHKINGNK
mmetsp:Transcript_5564/g.7691  ORF Transcript_5564/g.7691 Transcript_5564/m.7691 type:complete len:446 (-) Transcript_5564:153-1490(-)|eukprot:CAMPEP_0117734540 /NCGR_PEP_ID=MMETSP0947-20121206/737_1 /TAXON_ID=44440 /ORGANISM="Chattonella subsalsa, Strain CCMP2191" /LENGTH=445 /DNA_ID=CAMNT_0005549343 /DNA_START=88 /DNA_END=1425 /DNA_ORIENTATION=-